MKKYLVTFFLFVLFVFILAISIGSGDDDNTFSEDVEEQEIVEQIFEKRPEDFGLEGKSIDLADNPHREQTTELPINKAGHPEQIIKRIAYTVSFNSTTKCPNWVAWKLTREHTDGPFSRKGVPYYEKDGTASGIGVVSSENLKNIYFLDTEIKGPRQEFRDWDDKRYHVNHGHIMPAADNRWSKAAMNQSFYLSNICPQDIDLNAGDWENLENACRKWAKKYNEIYIVSGPIFNTHEYRTMGVGKVAIPDSFFKIVLRIGKTPEAIGFIYPNEGTHHDSDYYVRTVDEIENIIGFDVFSNLPDEIEMRIESTSDYNDW